MLTTLLGRAARRVGAYEQAVTWRERLLEHRADRRAQAQRRALHRLYGRFIRPGDLCFDVGANAGDRTRIFLALGASTVAIEPQPDCARLLRESIPTGDLVVIQKAVGNAEGIATIWTSPEVNTVASMSRDWIDRVRSSGRFSFAWADALEVEVTTLDALIATFGRPSFCKIDVEGFEQEVLAGLSEPVKALSFEFTPEYLDSAAAGVEHLHSLGYDFFTYSLGESGRLGRWMGSKELLAKLRRYQDDSRIFGDIYARLL
jgi:FkbM family methyltransferase